MPSKKKKFVFILNHPAHFHLFKNLIKLLEKQKDEVHIYIRPKDVLENLLKEENINYRIIQDSGASPKKKLLIIAVKFWELFAKCIKLLREASHIKPDFLVGTDWAITIVGRLLNIPSIIFNEDDTIATPENKVFYPLATSVIMPDVCDKDLWKNKKVTYKGYHELAYLSPKYFQPDKNVLPESLRNGKPYILIRLVNLSASHDIGKKGLDTALLYSLIQKYKHSYDFYFSSEKELPAEFEDYKIKISPKDIHHVLSYAYLIIGDSQTMIAEAAVLGVPSIRYNDFVGLLGYLEDLEHTYGLTTGIKTNNEKELFAKIEELLNQKDIHDEWQKKKETMLGQKIDVNEFFIEYFNKTNI